MIDAPDLECQLLQQIRCPLCGGTLASPRHEQSDLEGAAEAHCLGCGSAYLRTDGIWRMLTEAERHRYETFLEKYPVLRQREGRESDQAYFRAEEGVPPPDLTPLVASIRRRSLRTLDAILAEEKRPVGGHDWALDLGSGNGWLSRHLTHMGYRTVALDLTVAGPDSLAGARLFVEHDNIWLGRIQASMSGPPLCDEGFVLCTISAALHYANVEETLRSVHRVLKPGGLLVITDSPIYSDGEAGRAMAAEQQARVESILGGPSHELPGGQNYLVESQLLAQLHSLCFSTRTISIEHPLGRVRRAIGRTIRPGKREQARFPVIVGRKV